MKLTLKQDKAVAGLTILLSLIVLLFVIGLLVAIFSLMSAGIQDSDSIYERTSSISVGAESISVTDAGTQVANGGKRGAECSLVAIYNGTTVIGNGNVTESAECTYSNSTADFSYAISKINYTYTYLADEFGTAGVINDTSSSVGGVVDWFDIFIVIGSMVVLILLTVIIITAIRSSGMVAGGGQNNSVGTA